MKETNELRRLYEDFKGNLNPPAEIAQRLSAPLLLYPTERWNQAKTKVLIVGQETYGWGIDAGQIGNKKFGSIHTLPEFMVEDHSIDALMKNYEDFAFAKDYQFYGSPFWSAYRQIRRNFDTEVDGINSSVLWKNIFIMDYSVKGHKSTSVYKNTATWEEFYQVLEVSRGLLTKEINILKPDAIVFFTGPNYNKALEKEFEGIKYEKFNEHDVSRSAWLKHDSFGGALAVRTYHPRYLRTSNQWHVIDMIEKTVSK